jgi:hypothetical protein
MKNEQAKLLVGGELRPPQLSVCPLDDADLRALRGIEHLHLVQERRASLRRLVDRDVGVANLGVGVCAERSGVASAPDVVFEAVPLDPHAGQPCARLPPRRSDVEAWLASRTVGRPKP